MKGSWEHFCNTGKVEDYLAYRLVQESMNIVSKEAVLPNADKIIRDSSAPIQIG